MTEKEKIEFLLQLLKEGSFQMGVDRASALIQSYKWLLDKLKEESQPIVQINKGKK